LYITTQYLKDKKCIRGFKRRILFLINLVHLFRFFRREVSGKADFINLYPVFFIRDDNNGEKIFTKPGSARNS